MIRVTDRTLSCLDEYETTAGQLSELCRLLLELGADYIELSKNAYRKMGTLPKGGKYILQVGEVMEIPSFPGFDLYACRQSGFVTGPGVISEVQLNDINEIAFLRRCSSLPQVRITGLDDLFCHDYRMSFDQIRRNLTGKIELCPENGYYCATAIAVEWVLSGGRDVVSSWDGIGGFAATQEIFLSLRLLARYKPAQEYSAMPVLRKLMESITGLPTPKHRPISGEHIFDMEAGIHADGIAKDPQVYEPYKPELVGAARRLVLGKHSGRASIVLKLKELGISVSPAILPHLLQNVKCESIARQRSITDEEFLELIRLKTLEKEEHCESAEEVG